MAFEDRTNVDPWIAVGYARVCDERLEDTSGRADRQQAARLGRRARETVGRASRNDEYLSRPERVTLTRGLEVEAPFEDDERLLPGSVSVQGDAAPWRLKRLDQAV